MVEDDPTAARLLADLLGAAGCHVRVAATAEDAFVALRTCTPRFVLLDLMLPRMSGLMLARQLTSGARALGSTVVAVSAVDRRVGESLALEAGCAAFIAKPIDPETFVATVARHLDVHPSPTEAR